MPAASSTFVRSTLDKVKFLPAAKKKKKKRERGPLHWNNKRGKKGVFKINKK